MTGTGQETQGVRSQHIPFDFDSGRKIVAFPKKQTIFTQGDSSDVVLFMYSKER